MIYTRKELSEYGFKKYFWCLEGSKILVKNIMILFILLVLFYLQLQPTLFIILYENLYTIYDIYIKVLSKYDFKQVHMSWGAPIIEINMIMFSHFLFALFSIPTLYISNFNPWFFSIYLYKIRLYTNKKDSAENVLSEEAFKMILIFGSGQNVGLKLFCFAYFGYSLLLPSILD